MTHRIFSLERLKENLGLFGQMLQENEESRETKCRRCGVPLKGIKKRDLGDSDMGSYYVCIPCSHRVLINRILIAVFGILVVFLFMMVRDWLNFM